MKLSVNHFYQPAPKGVQRVATAARVVGNFILLRGGRLSPVLRVLGVVLTLGGEVLEKLSADEVRPAQSPKQDAAGS